MNGRAVQFFNLSMSGGFGGCYMDTNEPYNEHLCYVDGIECYANEARFGGIVVVMLVDVEG